MSNVSTQILKDAWKEVLLPYDSTRKQQLDKDWEVAGGDSSSNEKKAEVYQQLAAPAGSVRYESVEVP